MVDPFSGLVMLVAVVDAGGFRAAAGRLGVTAAAVSKAVAKLEGELGVTLLHRTSRCVSLTAEGAEYLARGREALALMKGAREAVEAARASPEGRVRVSASPILGPRVVAALGAAALRHPRLDFDLLLTDRVTRLAEEEIDVAVRVGEAHDQTLAARTLATPSWSTVASPAYLARKGVPRGDLAGHDLVAFVGPGGVLRALHLPAAAPLPAPRMTVDQGERLVDAALAGVGIAQVLDFMAREHLAAGRLIAVFPPCPGPTIRALCLPRRARTAKVRAVFDALVESFRAP